MMIKARTIDGFPSKIGNSSLDYPKSSNPYLFKLFFNYLGVASRGGGKTYNLVKIIKEFENNDMKTSDGVKHPIRTILISPTYEANKGLFDNLTSLSPTDIYEEYTEETLKKIIDDVNGIIEEVKLFKEYKYAYELIQKTPKDKIRELIIEQPELYETLKIYNLQSPSIVAEGFRYVEKPITFIILDDLMGSDAFNRKQQSLLKYWLIKNRHIFTSFFILVQSMKSVPKDIRLNCNVFYIAKFSNKKVILNDLYEEVSSIMKPEQFESIYDYAINSNDYGALIIDNSGEKKRFYNNLEKEIFIE
jgi:hypothetical protein